MTQRSSRKTVLPVVFGLFLPLGLACCTKGCKKDEPPPPMPSAAPAPTPSAPLVLAVEDAGPDVVDASDGGKKKVYGGGSSSGGLKACCNALSQNAASAPPPTSLYLMQAAAYCNAAAAQGKTSAAGIAGMLKGAGMPAACR